MKKIFLPALLLVAAMSSCSKNEIDSQQEQQSVSSPDAITINVATTLAKGSDVTTTTLESATDGVKLHIKDDSIINDAYTFTASGSDWSQSSTELKWGEINFPVHFFSMHDGTAKDLTVADSTATLDYTVEDESTNHKDLVYHASKLSAIPTGGTVNAYHKHALSKINILAGTGTNKVYIARVTLMNVDGEGTAEISSSTGAVTWDNGTSNQADYQYYYIGADTASMLASTTVNSVTTNPLINSDSVAPLMIIPQELTKATVAATGSGSAGSVTDSYIEVIYYLTDSEGAPLVGYSSVSARPDATEYIDEVQDSVLYVKAAFPLGYTFSDNKQYNITLGLGMCNSTGGLLVDDYYVNKDGDPVILTKKGQTEDKTTIPEIDPGDEILGDSDDLVDIIVDVSGWQEGDSFDLL